MAFYLVTAAPLPARLTELEDRLARRDFVALEPFGRALTYALQHARLRDDGHAVWEEEDYCRPPLKEERAAVLDRYFEDLVVEKVVRGEGWSRIERLPLLFGEPDSSRVVGLKGTSPDRRPAPDR
jgi:hypothetical protein